MRNPPPQRIPGADVQDDSDSSTGNVRSAAEAVLAGNWTGDHTVPSRTLYPHQWSWDSAFTAIGLAHHAPERAWTELRTLFAAQWSDGRVPHIVFSPDVDSDGYFPGAAFWASAQVSAAPANATSGIVQPPVHALAAWLVYRTVSANSPADSPTVAAARQELAWLYPRLVAQQRYLAEHRDLGGAGLACIVHPWESGLDNSPAWDGAMAAIDADPGLLRRYRRQDTRVAEAAQRPTDADYARFILVAESYRDGGYRDVNLDQRHPFLVECPLFNAFAAAAEHSLAGIARTVGADPQPHLDRLAALTEALVQRLFDPGTGTFCARDVRTGDLLRTHTVVGLGPLILPTLPAGNLRALLGEARSPRFGLAETMSLPLPTYDRAAADFDRYRYWRGPIWMNTNWLVWYGLRTHNEHRLATALRRACLDLVRRAGFHEYYDPTTGCGLGSAAFSWTAALTLDLLADAPARSTAAEVASEAPATAARPPAT